MADGSGGVVVSSVHDGAELCRFQASRICRHSELWGQYGCGSVNCGVSWPDFCGSLQAYDLADDSEVDDGCKL